MRRGNRNARVPVPEIVLLSVAAAILAVIVGTTAWAFATGRAKPGSGTQRDGETVSGPVTEGMFPDLGTLRAPIDDPGRAVVVVTPVFAYDPSDVAFREELVAKKNRLRAVITGWFRGKTKADLSGLGEEGVKRDLLDAINAALETGKVSKLFFTEYSTLD